MYAQNVFHIAGMAMFDEEESHVAKVVNWWNLVGI